MTKRLISWLLLIAAFAVWFVSYNDNLAHLRFWEEEPPQKICRTQMTNDNGYVFVIEACKVPNGMLVTMTVEGKLVEKVMFSQTSPPELLFRDRDFWAEYNARREQRRKMLRVKPPELQRQMYREDI